LEIVYSLVPAKLPKQLVLYCHIMNPNEDLPNCFGSCFVNRLFCVVFRIFGGFVNDIKNRYPYYLSDITDALTMQCVASIFFIFFAVISPVVTFGGVMGQKTEGHLVSIYDSVSVAYMSIAAFLISRITGPARPFVHLFVCHVELLSSNSKTKKRRKTKIGVNVPQRGSKKFAIL